MTESGAVLDMRSALMRLLGIPESRCDLAPERRGEADLGEIVVEKWLITAEPGSRIPVDLYRPASVDGPAPAIVMTCGHGDSKGVPHMTYVARVYARAGVACLLADPLGEEERHHEGGIGTRAHDAPDVAYRCELAGRPVMGKFVFDAMRGIDFLETLDWVDSDRMGVAGNSLGGAVAGWLYGLEPRLRLTIVSGWAFSDMLTNRWGKHCTRVPNQKLRAICDWPEFLRLGAAHGKLLVTNGDADVVIDSDSSGTVWRDTEKHVSSVDPSRERIRTVYSPNGGHRPYQGTKHALQFIHEVLGTPRLTSVEIAGLPEQHYGMWCDRYGVELEKLYGTELHYRGAVLPDFGLEPIPLRELAVLTPGEVGAADFTIDGWLAAWENWHAEDVHQNGTG